ncbi:rhodanese-like domain-containing protein [Cytobacillus sp. FJAT-54145]|uniref:Rhodanese-like domain-containing protein n=1 Tax=Cytobacillus spartinae TaxID=3299023 RepID=A0ABW6K654_9BACI
MTLRTITAKELSDKLKKNDVVHLLDVRAEEKYNDYHIKDPNIESLNIPKTQIFDLNMEAINLLPKKEEIIVTCTTGNSASKCAKILSEKGLQVVVLEGGITEWKTLNK